MEEQDKLETTTKSMVEPEHANTAWYRRDMEAYQTYKCKDCVGCLFMLRNIRNNIILRLEKYCSVLIVWNVIKVQFGRT